MPMEEASGLLGIEQAIRDENFNGTKVKAGASTDK